MDELSTIIAALVRQTFSEHGISLERLVFFGSRCTGNARDDSDWDFIAVAHVPVPMAVKNDIWLRVSRACSQKGVSVDVIIKTKEQYERDVHDVGKISYYASREGIAV